MKESKGRKLRGRRGESKGRKLRGRKSKGKNEGGGSQRGEIEGGEEREEMDVGLRESKGRKLRGESKGKIEGIEGDKI